MKIQSILLFCLVLCTGCASHHLNRNTVQHAGTLSDLVEQQVLNNLARFAVNDEATPHFEFPTSGGTDIGTKVDFGASSLNAFRTAIGLSGGRSAGSAWTLQPVTDPAKLKRMKCAFQRAVGKPLDSCDNCCALERSVNPGAKAPTQIAAYPDGTHTPLAGCGDPCLRSGCWFRKSCLRRDAIRSGCPFGEYNGTYVWVPDSGRAQFSDLVFDVLTYATQSPASPPKKLVTIYLDENGNPSNKAEAAQVVSAEIGFDKKNASLAQGAFVSPEFTPDNIDGLNPEIYNLMVPDPSVRIISAEPPTLESGQLKEFEFDSSTWRNELKRRAAQQSDRSQRFQLKAQEAAQEVLNQQAPVSDIPGGDFQRNLNFLQRFSVPDGQ